MKFIKQLFYKFIEFRSNIYTKYICKDIDYHEIPIIINNRNRYTSLKLLIESLQDRGYQNIIILDNDSTYKPLLDYYNTIKYRVIYLNKNLGYRALEKIKLYKKIRKNYFVYTDSDVIPVKECPSDFLLQFKKLFKKYPKCQKVGFSLKIDDLPDAYINKKNVISHESKFYENSLENNIYEADIDTTFALHKPYSLISTQGYFQMIRVGFPYQARHIPWYTDSTNISEEEKYYIDHVEIGTSWSKGLEINKKNIIDQIEHLTNII